jgi:hypothetical protein
MLEELRGEAQAMAKTVRPTSRRGPCPDDDGFVRRLLAQYLARVLARSPRLEYATLVLYLWLMDGELGELARMIRRGVGDELRERFDEALGEAEDNDDLARAARTAVGGRAPLKRAVLRSMRSAIARLGRQRTSGGRNSLGRNLERLQQTFRLSAAVVRCLVHHA